jgi:hypothetical protein
MPSGAGRLSVPRRAVPPCRPAARERLLGRRLERLLPPPEPVHGPDPDHARQRPHDHRDVPRRPVTDGGPHPAGQRGAIVAGRIALTATAADNGRLPSRWDRRRARPGLARPRSTSSSSARCLPARPSRRAAPRAARSGEVVKAATAGTVSLKAVLRKPLEVKTRITVIVSAPGTVSAVKCLQPGAAKAEACK